MKETKLCKRCGKDKPLDDFNSHPQTRDKKHTYCRQCQAEYVREKKYNIDPNLFQILLINQKFRCAICDKDMHDDIKVDHCHERNKVRGLLCNNCNVALGMFGDKVEIMAKAIVYITTSHEYYDRGSK